MIGENPLQLNIQRVHMQVIRQIGRGGFGDVDLVQDVSGNFYARKTFSVNQPGNFPADLAENVRKRFVREAEVQKALSHKNIMPVLSTNLAATPPSFLMPVADSSLDKDILANKNLHGQGILAVMDILAGLEELHSMGITHRDLKPQNVLRLNGGVPGVERYVISDFGLMSIKDTQLSVLTQTGMRMGSDYYTAPEIVADLRQASPQSDIYSIGCILHDMFGVGGRIPCNEVHDTGSYAEIILSCTRKDPKRRFQSVRDLRDAILSQGQLAGPTAQEPQVIDFINSLNSSGSIDLAMWDKIVDKVERLNLSPDAIALLRKIPLSRISELTATSPELARRFGLVYSAWVKQAVLSFDDCDGIANRLEAFLVLPDVNCGAEIRLALLMMGTSHNRWYVEKKFANHCAPSMPEGVAKRVAMEIRVMNKAACLAFSHLESSINIPRSSFHPLIVDTLGKVC